MDKRLIMAVLAVLLTMASATAADKYYYDSNTGYSGYANGGYMGSSKEGLSLEAVHDRGLNNLRNGGAWVGRGIGKLTREQNWLLCEAIREYDYSVGDIFVFIMGKNSSDYIAVSAEIISTGSGGHFSCDYYANPCGF